MPSLASGTTTLKKPPGLAVATKAKTSTPQEETQTLLAISPFEDDHAFLRSVFSRKVCCLYSSSTISEGLEFLRDVNPPVIITERDLPDGDWKEILHRLGQRADPALLIVASRFADDSLWAEVLNLGGYDVLLKPFDRGELTRVIHQAWSHQSDRLGRKTGKTMAAGSYY